MRARLRPTHRPSAPRPRQKVSQAPRGNPIIQKLKSGPCGEQSAGCANYRGICRVDKRDPLGEDEKADAGEGHECSSEKDGSVAGSRGSACILATDGLADADSGGAGDAEGNHVGECDCVQSDLVRGEGYGAEAGDERSHEGKDAAFRGDLHRGREAENDETLQARKVDVYGRFEKFRAVLVVIPE